MRFPRKSLVAALGVFFACAGVPAAASQAGYPQEPVKLVVSYAAGNVTDLVARMIGEKLSTLWKQSVLIENRPGAGGSLGAAMVAKARPDGYTLLFSAVAALAVNPHIYKNVHYDPLKDFDYITLTVAMPLVCVVNSKSDIKDFPGLIRYSKEHPGSLNYGSAGSGTISHLTMETLKAKYQLNTTHVPYKASSAVMTDLLGGRIQVACEPATVTTPLVRAGTLRAIGITSSQVLPSMPEVPTVASQIGPFSSGAWLGMLAPKGTPPAIVKKINSDLQTILKDPGFQAKMSQLGIEVLAEGPADFKKRERQDYDQYGAIVKRLNMKVD